MFSNCRGKPHHSILNCNCISRGIVVGLDVSQFDGDVQDGGVCYRAGGSLPASRAALWTLTNERIARPARKNTISDRMESR